jgi:hypothetical protein
MWVMLNDSFLSIVAHRSKRSMLVIRARRAEDISLVFPQARLIEGGGIDYEFRALVKRSVVQRAMAREVERIDYHNFKDSVRDVRRHDVYLTVWATLMRLGRRQRPLPVPIHPVDDFTLMQDE